ncbi:unnamed protein product, partial [Rotaria sordida]
NWWLGRWSNSERIRYGSTNIMSNCSSMEQSPITNMSNEEWLKERDKNFYVLFGQYSNTILEKKLAVLHGVLLMDD